MFFKSASVNEKISSKIRISDKLGNKRIKPF